MTTHWRRLVLVLVVSAFVSRRLREVYWRTLWGTIPAIGRTYPVRRCHAVARVLQYRGSRSPLIGELPVSVFACDMAGDRYLQGRGILRSVLPVTGIA